MSEKLPTAGEAKDYTKKARERRSSILLSRITDAIYEKVDNGEYDLTIHLTSDECIVADYVANILIDVGYKAEWKNRGVNGPDSRMSISWKD